jgi:hypothetical protein
MYYYERGDLIRAKHGINPPVPENVLLWAERNRNLGPKAGLSPLEPHIPPDGGGPKTELLGLRPRLEGFFLHERFFSPS